MCGRARPIGVGDRNRGSATTRAGLSQEFRLGLVELLGRERALFLQVVQFVQVVRGVGVGLCLGVGVE